MPGPAWLGMVVAWWGALVVAAAWWRADLAAAWPGWPWALAAAAVWGLNGLLLVYGIGPPFRVSRPPVLATAFALLMTLFGSGSYWATLQIYPAYRVGIERAACLVAVCTGVALAVMVAMRAALPRRGGEEDAGPRLSWDWLRLAATTYVLFALVVVGTLVSLGRIGYVPLLTGDPTSARVDFPSIGGVWYRFSMLGGVVALLVAVLAAARRASWTGYLVGLSSLALVGLYGPRFFVVLPLGAAVLLWDRVRSRVAVRRAVLLALVAAPLLALVGYARERDQSVLLLGPVWLLFYGTLGEFRDLGWALDYYGLGDRFLHGRTIAGAIVPVLPAPVWQLVGVDKAALYAQSSASFLADAMAVTAGQRVGIYGEGFMNFGWTGALIGAAVYGGLLGWLDERFRTVRAGEVRAVLLALVIATAVFAQAGQLNMFTSTLTGYGYPLLLVAVAAARRAEPAG